MNDGHGRRTALGVRVALLAVVFMMGAAPLRAQWAADGALVFPGPSANDPHVVPDGSGGAYVGCLDDGDHLVHILRLDASGNAVWPTAATSLGTASGDWSLLTDGLGGALVAYFPDVLERISAAGSVQRIWAGSGLRSIFDQLYSPMAAGSGGVNFATISTDPTHGERWLDLRRSGEAPWVVRVHDALPGSNLSIYPSPTLVLDAVGGVYLLTQSFNVTNDLLLQHFGADGSSTANWPSGGRVEWHSSPAVDAMRLVPVMAAPGGVYALWHTTDQRVYAQYVRVNGTARTSNVFALQVLDGTDQVEIGDAISRAGGGAFLGMTDQGSHGTDPWFARVIALDSLSNVVSDSPIADPRGGTILRRLVADGSGGAFVLWTVDTPDSSELRVQRLGPDGAPWSGWPATGVVIAPASEHPWRADAAMCGSDLIIAWESNSSAGKRVFASRMHPDGTVPTRIGFESATFSGAYVELTWRGDGGPDQVSVQRTVDGVSWQPIGATLSDGVGRYRFEDVAPATGTRVGYRLATLTSTPITEPAWVDAPSLTHLALRGFVAGAARPTLAFTLGSSATATLRVYDVQGRVCATTKLDAPAVGAQQATLDESLRAGVYLVQLAQAGKRITGRAVLLR